MDEDGSGSLIWTDFCGGGEWVVGDEIHGLAGQTVGQAAAAGEHVGGIYGSDDVVRKRKESDWFWEWCPFEIAREG